MPCMALPCFAKRKRLASAWTAQISKSSHFRMALKYPFIGANQSTINSPLIGALPVEPNQFFLEQSMIIIQNYVRNSQLFVCSLNHEQMTELFYNEKCSAHIPSVGTSSGDVTHWVAEPSAIEKIKSWCEANYHFCDEMIRKPKTEK